jgi:hypothetical protein
VPVTVTPETFTMVDFDAATIASLAEQLVGEAGLPESTRVEIEVIERTPLGRVRVESLEPLRISVEGGAFEDPQHIRKLSPARVVDVLGVHLFQVRDRLDPAFGGPPLDDELPLTHKVAWDVYAVGRLDRLGHRTQRQRRLYHFRNRHGFTDEADAAFERLWSADGLTWAEITALSDGAASAAAAAS